MSQVPCNRSETCNNFLRTRARGLQSSQTTLQELVDYRSARLFNLATTIPKSALYSTEQSHYTSTVMYTTLNSHAGTKHNLQHQVQAFCPCCRCQNSYYALQHCSCQCQVQVLWLFAQAAARMRWQRWPRAPTSQLHLQLGPAGCAVWLRVGVRGLLSWVSGLG